MSTGTTHAGADGWTLRFTALGPRLREAVALYEELGFEVRLEPADASTAETAGREGCAGCFAMAAARTIYTRPQHLAATRPRHTSEANMMTGPSDSAATAETEVDG